MMKLKGEKYCKAKLRNLAGERPVHLRLEYSSPQVSIFVYNHELSQFESCISMEHPMDFEGTFLISGGSAINNPDSVVIDQFTLYNLEEAVAEGHNQHFHDAHRKKAVHDMAQFDAAHAARDLVHNDMAFFNKEVFGEENLVDMLPTQLTMTKQASSKVLREMYNNLNYFYKVTGPLHSHKGYEAQLQSVRSIIYNMTQLNEEIDASKERLDVVEQTLLKQADEFFQRQDKNIGLDQGEKAAMFDETMSELMTSLNLAKKKFGVVDTKVEELGDMTEKFHEQTDRLEKLYARDIEKRQKHY
mmetsp:Transcript_5476/g.9278  ORF Transcript_5476/g.9278 Transcript_5476/m.9278 type:complete len:301 (+) Transcript_5476:531-1433(+)